VRGDDNRFPHTSLPLTSISLSFPHTLDFNPIPEAEEEGGWKRWGEMEREEGEEWIRREDEEEEEEDRKEENPSSLVSSPLSPKVTNIKYNPDRVGV